MSSYPIKQFKKIICNGIDLREVRVVKGTSSPVTVWGQTQVDILASLSSYKEYKQGNRLYTHTSTQFRGYYSSPSTNYGCCYSISTFDISNIETIQIICSQVEGTGNKFGIYTGTAKEQGYSITNMEKPITLSVGTLSIDVSSLSGQYGIVMTNGGSTNSATITSIIGIYK